MLFNSFHFIFLFLPVVLGGYYYIRRFSPERSLQFLIAASLLFYGWWNPLYVVLIIASCLFNFMLGRAMIQRQGQQAARYLLFAGITANLGLLAYFKYADFFISSLNTGLGTDFNLLNIVLPLAISFFTFQQIAYLVDTYRGETAEYSFSHYCLFVTFFPQLIAGPIVHHKEMLPQFERQEQGKTFEFLSQGGTLFILGLCKKVVLADSIAVYASPVFAAADAGTAVTFFEAWAGALAYTLQLYFDFSGYSDMAIGLGLMFGVKLPVNFLSPYKSDSIIEFWRRWHITLSRFLRDYLYIALGGNRKGEARRYLNLFLTMLLGGLWHGAAWTYVVWGGLHGAYLGINHGWRKLTAQWQVAPAISVTGRYTACLLTFLAVVVSWVFFRAASFEGAFTMLSGMAGLNGFMLSADADLTLQALSFLSIDVELSSYATRFVEKDTLHWILGLLLICWLMPNTSQIMQYDFGAIQRYSGRFQWRMSKGWVFSIALVGAVSVINLFRVSEFLYFQF